MLKIQKLLTVCSGSEKDEEGKKEGEGEGEGGKEGGAETDGKPWKGGLPLCELPSLLSEKAGEKPVPKEKSKDKGETAGIAALRLQMEGDEVRSPPQARRRIRRRLMPGR